MKLAALSRTEDGYVATFERILPHPPEKVWEAVGTAEGISRWCVPAELDPEVGGRFVAHHDHVGVVAEEEVLAYEPGRVFEHTQNKGWGGQPPYDSVRWQVEPHEEGSRLVVTFRFHSLGPAATGGLSGIHVWLDVLEAVLGGDDPEAHEPPHMTFQDGKPVVKEPPRGRWTGQQDLMVAYGRAVKAELR